MKCKTVTPQTKVSLCYYLFGQHFPTQHVELNQTTENQPNAKGAKIFFASIPVLGFQFPYVYCQPPFGQFNYFFNSFSMYTITHIALKINC